MIVLKGGEITLHDEKTKRQWSVSLKPFAIAKFAVTEQLYSLFNPTQAITDQKNPVTQVTWYEAIRFCNFLSELAGLQTCYTFHSEEIECNWENNGYRLPSEAEWEHACRAGTTEVSYGELDSIAWHKENSGNRVHTVGLKIPNDWGLYDTIGNVWEWCWDLFDSEVYGPYRVFRGGGWFDSPRGCRASCRHKSHPTFEIDDLGFRLARSLPINN